MTLDPDELGAQYRDAKNGVTACRHRQADAELDRARFIKTHRRGPHDDAYHDELDRLDGVVQRAYSDVQWCRSVVVACGEAIKGEPFETVAARNAENGPPAFPEVDA